MATTRGMARAVAFTAGSMLLLLAKVGKPNFGVMETRGHPFPIGDVLQ
jgi:hypothetical protein